MTNFTFNNFLLVVIVGMGRSGPVRSGPEKTGLLAKTGPDRFIKPVHKPVYQIRSTY